MCPCYEHRAPKFSMLSYLSRVHHDTTAASTFFFSPWSHRFSAFGQNNFSRCLVGRRQRHKTSLKSCLVLGVSMSSRRIAPFICFCHSFDNTMSSNKAHNTIRLIYSAISVYDTCSSSSLQFKPLSPHFQKQLWLHVQRFLTRCFLKGWSYFQSAGSQSSFPMGMFCFPRKWKEWKQDTGGRESRKERQTSQQKTDGYDERQQRQKWQLVR